MLGKKRLGLLALCGLFALVHISSRGDPVGLEEVVFQVPDARMLAATQKKMDEGQIQVRHALGGVECALRVGGEGSHSRTGHDGKATSAGRPVRHSRRSVHRAPTGESRVGQPCSRLLRPGRRCR
jgi:hypothetical protein